MAENATSTEVDRLVARIAALAMATQQSVGVAESLTGGQLSTALAAGKDSGSWYRGAVVCYHSEVKFELLGVHRGPVITARTARELAVGAARVLGADITVGVTGVGGPGPEEGQPAGTVYHCVAAHGRPHSELQCRHSGDTVAVLHDTITAALHGVLGALEAAALEGA